MSFNNLLAEPKTYLAMHKVQVRSDACVMQAMTVAAKEDCVGSDLQSQRWTQRPGGPYLTMMRMLGHGQAHGSSFTRSLRAHASALPGVSQPDYFYQLFPNGNVDLGFRWLQFTENTCTYMDIDAGASFVMTGPLSGCTIAFGRKAGGGLVMLHANCNRSAGVGARMQQALMIVNTCRDKLNGTVAGRLLHAEYHTAYEGMGFVFAIRRGGGTWKLYGYGTTSGVRKVGEV